SRPRKPSTAVVPAIAGMIRLRGRPIGWASARRSSSPPATVFIWQRLVRMAGPTSSSRGGPPGLIKVLRPDRVGFANYRGNRQYISVGNIADDSRVALFLMDYPRRARLKLLGRARIVKLAETPELAQALVDEAARAPVERGIVIDVEAYDWNCSQHITPRFMLAEIAPTIANLQARIAELEAGLARSKTPAAD